MCIVIPLIFFRKVKEEEEAGVEGEVMVKEEEEAGMEGGRDCEGGGGRRVWKPKATSRSRSCSCSRSYSHSQIYWA